VHFSFPLLFFRGMTGCTYEDGEADYRGTAAMSESGRACQSWSAQTPHPHQDVTAALYPTAGLGAHSYCRNPTGEAGLWCYTMDPLVTWEFCGACELPAPPTHTHTRAYARAHTDS